MLFLPERLLLMALALAIFPVGHAAAAEGDILGQMRGKSAVSKYVLLVGKYKFPMSDVIYFSNEGDVFYYLLKDHGRKIPKGSESVEENGGKLSLHVDGDLIIIENISGGADSSIFTSRHYISEDSCRRSDEVYSPPGTKSPPKLVSLQCWIEDGRSEFGQETSIQDVTAKREN